MEFSRQEYWSRETFPSQGDLQGSSPTQGLNSGLSHCRQMLYHLSHREAPIILWLYTNCILCLALTFTALASQTSPCSSSLFALQKQGLSKIHERQWIQLLGYGTTRPNYQATWWQPMTVFETMQEEEYKMLPSLFFIICPWLWAFLLVKPIDSPWKWGTVLVAWVYSVLPLHQLRIKASSLFSPNSVSVLFYLASVDRESQDFGHNISSTYNIYHVLYHIRLCCTLLSFSRPVMSYSSWPHGLQHARPPCPSPSPGVCPNSCPLHWWCHSAISSSVILFSSSLQSFPASGSYLMSPLFV